MKIDYEMPKDTVIKLKKLIRKLEQVGERMETDIVSQSQFRVITPIIRDGTGYSIQQLTELVGVDKALVSRTIADLESKGIVARDKKADSNEKKYKIVLTEKGKTLLESQLLKAKEVSIDLLNGVTREDLLVFKKVLNTLTE